MFAFRDHTSQHYLSYPIIRFHSLVFSCAISAAFALSGCTSKSESEDVGDMTESDHVPESGIKPKVKKKKKSKDKPGDKGEMPNLPGDNSKKPDGSAEDGPSEVPEDPPCEIDFLFVIDHSGSMESEQENLSNAVPEFIKTVTEEIDELEDYHIAVVTTGADGLGLSYGSPGCEKMGGMVTLTFGKNSSDRLCGPYANGKKFMTKADDLEDVFVCAAKPGTNGTGDEKPIDAMLAAVSQELNTEECNAGFLRKEALLVVTIITDEEDDVEAAVSGSGSKGDPEDWYNNLIAVKGNDPKNVVVLGLIGTEENNECKPLLSPKQNLDVEGAQISKRLMSFVEKFDKRGVIGDVCANSYGEFFRKAVGVIDLACEEKPPI